MALSREAAQLVNELTTLEVSTLVLTAPSGAKAPPLPRQLTAIQQEYEAFRYGQIRGAQRVSPPREKLMSFEELAAWAGGELAQRRQLRASSARAAVAPDEDEVLLLRVLRYSEQLAGVKPRRATTTEAIAVRKGYEIGVEPIYMSTKVSLTGDVFTQFARLGGDPPDPALQQLHGTLVGFGLQQWQGLMGAVAEFVRTALGFFLR